MKKKLALLLAIVMTVSLFAACGSSDSGSTDTPGTDTPAATTDTTTDGDSTDTTDDTPAATGTMYKGDTTPITFTFFSEDGNRDQPFDTVIAQKITEITGVTLRFDYPVGEVNTRIPLMVASGDLPDLVYGKGTGSAQLIDAGAAINLAPMIENSNYVKDFYGDLLSRLWYEGDSSTIYSFGAYQINQPIWNVESSMPIQNAVLKEFGYPEIRTVYDVEDLIRRYVELYPEINGRPTYGLTINNADGWRYIIDLGNPAGHLTGFHDDGEWIVDETTLEASIKYLNPALKEHFAWLNKMWNEGLIDPDSFTQTNDDYIAKISNGQVLALLSPQWQYNDARLALINNGMGERTYAHLPITYDANVRPVNSYDIGWSGGWGVMITNACSDPQRAFDFVDWMTSEEGLTLRYWGVEGIHYDVVDGIRVLKPEVRTALDTDPDYGNAQGFDWAYPFPEMGDGHTDSTGSTITRNTTQAIIDAYTDEAKETLAAYGAEMWADLFPPTSDFELSPFGAAWQIDVPPDSEINDRVQWVQNTWMPQEMSRVVTASTDDFEQLWEEAQQKLIDGRVYELNEMFTELVRAKARAWGNY